MWQNNQTEMEVNKMDLLKDTIMIIGIPREYHDTLSKWAAERNSKNPDYKIKAETIVEEAICEYIDHIECMEVNLAPNCENLEIRRKTNNEYKMSSACRWKWSDLQDEETLYRHYDGHPKYMIPVIYRAWIWANDEYLEHRVGMARIVDELYTRETLKSLNGRKFTFWLGHGLLLPIILWVFFPGRSAYMGNRHLLEELFIFDIDLTLADFKLIESRQNIEDLVKKYNGAERINFSAIK